MTAAVEGNCIVVSIVVFKAQASGSHFLGEDLLYQKFLGKIQAVVLIARIP